MSHNSAQPEETLQPSSDNGPKQKISLLVADRNERASKEMLGYLQTCGHFEISGRVTKADAILSALSEGNPQILILGLPFPRVRIEEIIAQVRDAQPHCGIVLIGDANDSEAILAGLAAGARSCVLRESDPDLLRSAIMKVRDGDVWIDPGVEAIFRELVGDAISSNSAVTSTDLFERKLQKLSLLHTIELTPVERRQLAQRARLRHKFHIWQFLAVTAVSLFLVLALLPLLIMAINRQPNQPDSGTAASTTQYKGGQALRTIELR